MTASFREVSVVDSHTAGEPTRVVLAGCPDLGRGSLADRREVFRTQTTWFRAAVVNEPRGSDVLVGAVLCEPVDPASAAGVIFFNNVGYLNMCGHGTIGLVVTLAHTGKLAPGEHRIETPVGTVTTVLHPNGEVTVQNVPAYRLLKAIELKVEGYGILTGDVAWGGNWFFLTHGHGLDVTFANLERLTDCAWKIRRALGRQGIVGAGGQEIDHIELFGPPTLPDAHGKNFVLCPGGAYDRSPCGTGTSAELACLVADGLLREGEVWRQESVVGSLFEGSVRIADGVVHPSVKGSAFITAEARLLLDPRDPFVHGIPPAKLP